MIDKQVTVDLACFEPEIKREREKSEKDKVQLKFGLSLVKHALLCFQQIPCQKLLIAYDVTVMTAILVSVKPLLSLNFL